MDKLDFAILNTLGEVNASTRLQAVSRKQILERVQIGAQNLFIRLKKLREKGIIADGLKDGREHTYFITEVGKQLFEEELG